MRPPYSTECRVRARGTTENDRDSSLVQARSLTGPFLRLLAVAMQFGFNAKTLRPNGAKEEGSFHSRRGVHRLVTWS